MRLLPPSFQFLIHCEGTRFTEKKHEISMQVARAKGLPRLKHHLLPRTKGFAITVRSLRNVGKEECVALGLPVAARKTSPSSGWAELASCQHFPADLRLGAQSGCSSPVSVTGNQGQMAFAPLAGTQGGPVPAFPGVSRPALPSAMQMCWVPGWPMG